MGMVCGGDKIEVVIDTVSVHIDGVHFDNLSIQGNPVTSTDDPDADWDIADGVTNVTFQ